MHKKSLLVELSSRWTLAHSENGLPANELVEKLKAVLPAGTEFKQDAFTEITISVDVDCMQAEMVVATVVDQFCKLYGEESKNAITVTIQEAKEEAKPEGKSEDLIPPTSASGALFPPKGGLFGKKEEGAQEAKTEEKPSVDEEIDGLIAGEDFKDLAKEFSRCNHYIIFKENKNGKIEEILTERHIIEEILKK